ncbi:Hypothetical_protein [Hexamita inflata]|uniref:Hypothetical_protein n=1 Tax=Hexamita inflata TaxID=28002 RepID=A0AA86UER3_9EUKA|nr:Hypothetical protein HINF_LOCUS42900 [Hexamita inflata]
MNFQNNVSATQIHVQGVFQSYGSTGPIYNEDIRMVFWPQNEGSNCGCTAGKVSFLNSNISQILSPSRTLDEITFEYKMVVSTQLIESGYHKLVIYIFNSKEYNQTKILILLIRIQNVCKWNEVPKVYSNYNIRSRSTDQCAWLRFILLGFVNFFLSKLPPPNHSSLSSQIMTVHKSKLSQTNTQPQLTFKEYRSEQLFRQPRYIRYLNQQCCPQKLSIKCLLICESVVVLPKLERFCEYQNLQEQ